MSIMAELYGLLRHQAGLENDEIADVMEKWYEDGVLSDNYLIQLGFIGLRRKDGGDGIGYFEKGVIEALDDKVVQDVDGTEGTGTWSNMETANRHVAAPSLNASHNLRTMSARKGERIKTAEALKLPQPGRFDIGDKDVFIKKVTGAAEAGIFAAFTQGFAVRPKSSRWTISQPILTLSQFLIPISSSRSFRTSRSGTSSCRSACGSGRPAASSARAA